MRGAIRSAGDRGAEPASGSTRGLALVGRAELARHPVRSRSYAAVHGPLWILDQLSLGKRTDRCYLPRPNRTGDRQSVDRGDRLPPIVAASSERNHTNVLSVIDRYLSAAGPAHLPRDDRDRPGRAVARAGHLSVRAGGQSEQRPGLRRADAAAVDAPLPRRRPARGLLLRRAAHLRPTEAGRRVHRADGSGLRSRASAQPGVRAGGAHGPA